MKPLIVAVQANDVTLQMEIDTGTSVSLISKTNCGHGAGLQFFDLQKCCLKSIQGDNYKFVVP